MKSWLLSICLLTIACSASAQSYREGWLVMDGDTLKGQVADKDALIFYRLDKHSQSESYLKKDVTSYGIGEDLFRCTDVDVMNGKFTQRQFLCLELEIRGKCNLWLGVGKDVYGNPWDNYYVEREGYPLIMVRKDRAIRKQLFWYFEDNEALANRIKSGELGYDNLADIVREFNSWAEGRQAPNP